MIDREIVEAAKANLTEWHTRMSNADREVPVSGKPTEPPKPRRKRKEWRYKAATR